MPALVLFGQKTALAGDDLRCSSTVFFVFRIIQFVLLLPTLVFLVQVDDTYVTDENGYGVCEQVGTSTSNTTITETGAVLTNTNTSSSTDSTLAATARTDAFIYWGLSMLQVILGVSLEVAIWRTSGIGTPTEPEKRAALRPLCFGKLVLLTALRVSTFVMGVVSLSLIREYCECSSSVVEEEVRRALIERRCPQFYGLRRAMAGLAWTQGMEVIVVAFIYVVFIFKIFKPGKRLRNVMTTVTTTTISPEFWWGCICRSCCACTSIFTCCFLGGIEAVTSDFAAVAMALTDIMDDGGHLDVTFSDIVAGLRMVRRVQKEEQEALENREKIRAEEDPGSVSDTSMDSGGVERRGTVRMSLLVRDEGSSIFCEAAERRVLDGGDAADRQVIAEGAHFMRLSLAIYGYIMYVIQHNLTGPCLLTAISLNCKRSCCWWSKDKVVGDNICGCYLLAMLRQAGLDEEDIEYAQFGAGVIRNPYCITVDHEWKSVVITIRGTLSLEDAVTDLSIRPESLSEWAERCSFDGQGEYCHEGMLASAEWVLRDLEKNGILDELLLADHCRYPGYQLYVAGHSLGAGCAAILALMLKPKFPSLKCLCFEPPAVMSARVAGQTFITSFILDADIVPRLSYHSLENLRNDMLDLIARIKVPKYQIMAGLSQAKTFAESNAETLRELASIDPSTFSRQVEKFKEHQQGMYGIHVVVYVFSFAVTLVLLSNMYLQCLCRLFYAHVYSC
jgi:sn1-specific diacylglycerol lipase